MTTNAEHAANCRRFAAEAASQRTVYADGAMDAELHGDEALAGKARALAEENRRGQAAWLILAAAFDVTTTPPEADEILDVIDLAETRDLARRLRGQLEIDEMPEQDCANCGERIILVPVKPQPRPADREWFHAATGSRYCKRGDTHDPDAPAPQATPPDPYGS